MNFAQMLAHYAEPPKKQFEPAVKRVGRPRNTDMSAANKVKMEQSKAKYRNVMGSEWVHTRIIECRLGMERSVAYKTLRTYEGRGWVECRPVGGEVYNRRKGWEWRWIE